MTRIRLTIATTIVAFIATLTIAPVADADASSCSLVTIAQPDIVTQVHNVGVHDRVVARCSTVPPLDGYQIVLNMQYETGGQWVYVNPGVFSGYLPSGSQQALQNTWFSLPVSPACAYNWRGYSQYLDDTTGDIITARYSPTLPKSC